jgi:transcriptional regulator with XRE-family HTH domain
MMDHRTIMSNTKEYMRNNKVKAVDVAHELHINPQRLRNWLNGLFPPTIEDYLRLCHALQVHPCRFIPGAEEFSAKAISLYDLLDAIVQESVRKTLAKAKFGD